MSKRPNLRVVPKDGHYDGAAQEKADRAQLKAEKKAAESRGEASFKLDLIKSACSDPRNTSADVRLLLGYVFEMKWPARSAWLVNSHAKAATALSTAQVSASRSRLIANGYLIFLGKRKGRGGSIPVFGIENPRELDLSDHVQDEKKRLLEVAAERKAERRRARNRKRAADEVIPEIGETRGAMSTQKLDGVVPEIRMDSPLSSLSDRVSRGTNGRRGASAAISGNCFSGLSDLLNGRQAPDGVQAYWRQAEAAGTLDAGMVEEYFASRPVPEIEIERSPEIILPPARRMRQPDPRQADMFAELTAAPPPSAASPQRRSRHANS